MAMTSQKKKNRSLTSLLLVVGIIVLLGITAKYIWLPIVKNTSLYNQAYKAYQDNRWVTFTSERAKFSFEHPISWPVTPASDEQLKENNQDFIDGKWIQTDNEIENIDFQEEWVRNAGGPRLGFIIVQKTNYKNLKEYVDEISKEKVVDMFVKGRSQKVTIKPPKIEYLKIGGEDAISLTDTNDFATFTRETIDYQLIRNGWLYRFATTDSSRFLENKEKNSETFQKMISSIKFID